MRMSEKLDAEINEIEAGLRGSRADEEGTSDAGRGKPDGQPSGPRQQNSPSSEANQHMEPVENADPPKSDTLEKRVDWEYRYKQFKRSADQTIHGLRQEIATLKRSNLESQERAEDALKKVEDLLQKERMAERRSKLFSQDVVGIVGEDVAKTLAETIDASIADEVGPLKDELAATRKKELEDAKRAEADLSVKAERNFRESYTELIARNGFDFETINYDPNFVSGFLNTPDPITGELRREALDRAILNKDASGVAKLFVSYGMKVKSDFSEVAEPLGEGVGAPTTKVTDTEPAEEFVTKQEIDDFYSEGYKTMSASEIDAFEAKVVRCAENNQIR